MNAFVTTTAGTPFDSSTTLPTQIFMWADSPERGFIARTSAAILVLLAFLILMNLIAIILRRKFERQW
jgi:phosphate transport system permease protein